MTCVARRRNSRPSAFAQSIVAAEVQVALRLPAEILAVADAVGGLSEAERAAENEFMRALLQGRNAIMAERAAPLLVSGGAFVAVGALHLSGRTGLIERFRAMGYTVIKVW